MNKETLFGAGGRDKQRPVLGRGDLPGTEAGTAEGDLRSGTRKRAGCGSQQAPGGPRDQGAEKVAARSRGRAVTWTGRLALRRARSSVRLRSAARGERPSVGAGWLRGRGSCRHQSLSSAAGPPSLPAERLVHCLPRQPVRPCAGDPACLEPPRGALRVTVLFGPLSWERKALSPHTLTERSSEPVQSGNCTGEVALKLRNWKVCSQRLRSLGH